MFKRLLGLALTFGLAAAAPPVFAAPCGDRVEMVERLQKKYDEHLTAGGLQTTNSTASMMEIWASSKTGTFTVLLTNPHGISCVMAVGTDFFATGPDPAPEDTES